MIYDTDIPRLVILPLQITPPHPHPSADACMSCISEDSGPLSSMILSPFYTSWIFMTFALINQAVKRNVLIPPVNHAVYLPSKSICTQGGLQKINTESQMHEKMWPFFNSWQFRACKITGFRLECPTLFSWCADKTFCGKNNTYMSVLPWKVSENVFLNTRSSPPPFSLFFICRKEVKFPFGNVCDLWKH